MDNLELLNYVNILGKDQAGCRMLQKRIHNDIQYALQVYLKVSYFIIKLRPNLIEYMFDSFGNYLIQKILEHLPIDKIREIIFIIENYISSSLIQHIQIWPYQRLSEEIEKHIKEAFLDEREPVLHTFAKNQEIFFIYLYIPIFF